MKKSIVFLLLALALLIGGLVGWTWCNRDREVADENWERYSYDAQYEEDVDFSIAHPSDMTEVEAPEAMHYLSHPVAALHTDAAQYRLPNYHQEAWIVVSEAGGTEESCYAAMDDDAIAFTYTQIIGGVPFRVAHFEGAGAGNRYETTVYRRYRGGGHCLEIATTLHTASDWTEVDEARIADSQQAMLEDLERSVASFQFE